MSGCFTGINKLGLSCSPSECSVVLDEDGSVVDDDILREVHGHTLILLCPGEEWMPVYNSQEIGTTPVLTAADVELEQQSSTEGDEPVPHTSLTPNQPHCENFSKTSGGLFFKHNMCCL